MISHSVERTIEIGRVIGQALRGGEVIALIGALGAGKTHLVKGIALGAGYPTPEDVTSPTFVLVNEYRGRLVVHHLDTYRLSGPMDLLALGFDEMCESGGVVVIEWADKVEAALPDDHILIQMSVVSDSSRIIELDATGPASLQVLDRLDLP